MKKDRAIVLATLTVAGLLTAATGAGPPRLPAIFRR